MFDCQRFTLLSIAMAAAFPASALEPGEAMPALSLPSLKGGSVSLGGFRDRVVLVNFWATWCGPCRRELPAFEVLRQRYKHQGFDVVGINVDSEPALAAAFVEEFKLSYPLLSDPEFNAAKAFGADAMPISYLVGRDGRIARVFAGFSPKKLPTMESAIAQTVAGSAP